MVRDRRPEGSDVQSWEATGPEGLTPESAAFTKGCHTEGGYSQGLYGAKRAPGLRVHDTYIFM